MKKIGISKRHLQRIIKKERDILLKRLELSLEEAENNEENANVENCERDVATISGSTNCFDEGNENKSLTDNLRDWYIRYNPSRESFVALLKILQLENLNGPRSLQSVLKNSERIQTRTVPPGEYFHFGIKKQLEKVSEILIPYNEVLLNIGIDGLPLYKSSALNLWPILGNVVNLEEIKVFLIGAYIGKKKPSNIDVYLHDFVNEVRNLKSDGLILLGKRIEVKIMAFICDAPAKSFVSGIIGHNAFNGCSKCRQIGRSVDNVVTYRTSIEALRTDDDFKNRVDKNHHNKYFWNRPSALESLGIGMVSQFPLDPMHLVDLGITRKILLALINGTTAYPKLTTNDKILMSTRLTSLAPFIPKEFVRKRRSLDEILKWKATEFRQFILYTGILVLKDVIHEDVYYHFLLLHSAYRLLSCPKNYEANLNVAMDLIKSFVENFPIVYREKSVTYNVHNLLHLPQCVKEIGFINNFSAYKLENCMQDSKREIKKPSKILQQLNNKTSIQNPLRQVEKYGFKRNRDEIGALKETFTKQNKELMEATATNTAILKKLVEVETVQSEMASQFPIDSKEDLEKFNTNIEGNENEIIATIKRLLHPEGLKKNMSRLFGTGVIINYNYHGTKGKNSFKELKQTNDVLFKAIKKEGYTEADFLREIRESFHVHKNRYFKRLSINKKKEESQS